MIEDYRAFVEVCKKFGLRKDNNLLSLFKVFYDIKDFGVCIMDKEDSERRLVLAKVIKMLNRNKAITITDDFDRYTLNSGYVLEELKAFFNTLLGHLTYCSDADFYPHKEVRGDIVEDGKRMKLGNMKRKHKWNFKVSYSESELDSIIAFEERQMQMAGILSGRKPFTAAYKGGIVRILEGASSQLNLQSSSLKLLCWYLMELLGYAQETYGTDTDSKKRKEIVNWEKALDNAERKIEELSSLKPSLKPINKQTDDIIEDDFLSLELNKRVEHEAKFDEIWRNLSFD